MSRHCNCQCKHPHPPPPSLQTHTQELTCPEVGFTRQQYTILFFPDMKQEIPPLFSQLMSKKIGRKCCKTQKLPLEGFFRIRFQENKDFNPNFLASHPHLHTHTHACTYIDAPACTHTHKFYVAVHSLN